MRRIFQADLHKEGTKAIHIYMTIT